MAPRPEQWRSNISEGQKRRYASMTEEQLKRFWDGRKKAAATRRLNAERKRIEREAAELPRMTVTDFPAYAEKLQLLAKAADEKRKEQAAAPKGLWSRIAALFAPGA